MRDGFGDHGLHLRFVGDVGDDDVCPPTCRLNLRGQLGQCWALGVHVVQSDVIAIEGQLEGYGTPDALRGAGDERDSFGRRHSAEVSCSSAKDGW